jgi:hypothetical protein
MAEFTSFVASAEFYVECRRVDIGLEDARRIRAFILGCGGLCRLAREYREIAEPNCAMA